MEHCTIRQDITEDGCVPGTLKGFPMPEPEKYRYRYACLENDTPEGYNIVIWLPDRDFVDLANSIDFDFHEEGK